IRGEIAPEIGRRAELRPHRAHAAAELLWELTKCGSRDPHEKFSAQPRLADLYLWQQECGRQHRWIACRRRARNSVPQERAVICSESREAARRFRREKLCHDAQVQVCRFCARRRPCMRRVRGRKVHSRRGLQELRRNSARRTSFRGACSDDAPRARTALFRFRSRPAAAPSSRWVQRAAPYGWPIAWKDVRRQCAESRSVPRILLAKANSLEEVPAGVQRARLAASDAPARRASE